MIPSSDHNETLSGDTLYSVFLNYEWREIVVAAVIEKMNYLASTINDETELQDFEVRYGALIDDLYNEDAVDGTPVGTIINFVGEIADIPAKWRLCNGASLLGSSYPELFAIMPASMISGANFTLPALSGRFVRSTANDSDVGNIGGSNSHTLTTAELPAHSHTIPSHSHTVSVADGAGSQGRAARGTNTNVSTFNTSTAAATVTGNEGSGNSFSTLPSHQFFLAIIKVLP